MLPDLPLLGIFHFYVDKGECYALVHVCRKWRNVVFGSPRRLNRPESTTVLQSQYINEGGARSLATQLAYCSMG